MKYYYSAFNLVIQSDLVLPGLQAIPIPVHTPDLKNQISIVYGVVSKDGLGTSSVKGVTYQSNAAEFWLDIKFIARFLVSNGHTITIDPQDGVDEDSLGAFLLSACFEALLRQRGLTLVPGYALKMGNFCVAFADPIGVGQAMLQCLFYKRGYSFLSGEFLAINEQGYLLPGFAQLVCWSQVISASGMEVKTLKPLRPGIEKYVIPLAMQYHNEPMLPKVVYTLKKHQHPDIIFSPADEGALALPMGIFGVIEVICIHVPVKGLRLQQLADCIEQQIKEGNHAPS